MPETREFWRKLGAMFTKEGDIFQRTFNCRNPADIQRLPPTIPRFPLDNKIPEDTKGYYVGDPDKWVQELLLGKILHPKTVCVAKLEFPPGTPYFNVNRESESSSPSGYYVRDIYETFVIFSHPIKPKSVEKISEEDARIMMEEEWEEEDV